MDTRKIRFRIKCIIKNGDGVVSGSSQVLDILTSLNSPTGSYLTTVDISDDTNLKFLILMKLI